jgi:hypothetical protein
MREKVWIVVGGYIGVVALLAFVWSVLWLRSWNYRECRAHGFSRVYCVSR